MNMYTTSDITFIKPDTGEKIMIYNTMNKIVYHHRTKYGTLTTREFTFDQFHQVMKDNDLSLPEKFTFK